MVKREGKRTLGRPRLRSVDNIKIDVQEVECGYVVCELDWVGPG